MKYLSIRLIYLMRGLCVSSTSTSLTEIFVHESTVVANFMKSKQFSRKVYAFLFYFKENIRIAHPAQVTCEKYTMPVFPEQFKDPHLLIAPRCTS